MAETVRERFYAVSAERRLPHPSVVAISGAERHGSFNRALGFARLSEKPIYQP